MSEKEKGDKKGKGGMILAGVVAAAAAGAAYLYGKHGQEHRQKVKRWMRKAKHDVLEKLENMEEVGKREYEEIVDSVTEKYRKKKDITEDELRDFSSSLKRHWSVIAEEAQGGIEDAKEKVSTLRKRLKEETEEVSEEEQQEE